MDLSSGQPWLLYTYSASTPVDLLISLSVVCKPPPRNSDLAPIALSTSLVGAGNQASSPLPGAVGVVAPQDDNREVRIPYSQALNFLWAKAKEGTLILEEFDWQSINIGKVHFYVLI